MVCLGLAQKKQDEYQGYGQDDQNLESSESFAFFHFYSPDVFIIWIISSAEMSNLAAAF
jgi:hypothetical protein